MQIKDKLNYSGKGMGMLLVSDACLTSSGLLTVGGQVFQYLHLYKNLSTKYFMSARGQKYLSPVIKVLPARGNSFSSIACLWGCTMYIEFH